MNFKLDPQKAEQVRKAYLPIRDDSTFEFTIENVKQFDGTVIVFGSVTKGIFREGYQLEIIHADGKRTKTTCKAIAGLSQRLFKASTQEEEANIGIWLDTAAQGVAPYDRIVSFDTESAAREVTPRHWSISVLHGVKK